MSRDDAWKFLLATSPICLLLMWLVACSVRGSGWLIFAGGVSMLGVASLLLFCSRRTPLFALYLGVLMAALTLAAVEGALWLAPGMVSGDVACRVYSTYHTYAGGMYQRDDHLGYAFRPRFQTWAYANGHWWRHDANAHGFRGADPSRAEAVFLGDSMIYGHGVETAETVSAQFEALTARRAANLGVHGSDTLRALMLLDRHGGRLKPDTVFVCCHPNDIDDLATMYDDDELRKFLDSPVSEPYLPLVRPHLRRDPTSIAQWWQAHLAVPLRTCGLIGSVRARLADLVTSTPPAPPRPFETNHVPGEKFINAPFELESPGRAFRWRCHCHALEAIQAWCDQHYARLIVFDLGYPRAFSAKIEEWATAHGVSYSPAGAVVLQQALRGAPMYLANDGHWTAAGCRAIARALAETTAN